VLLDAEQVGARPGESLIARDPKGNQMVTQWVDERTSDAVVKPRLAVFVDLPACGWTRLDLIKANVMDQLALALYVRDEGGRMVLSSPALQVAVDKNTGAIVSILDRKSGHEALSPGKGARLIDIHEADNEMSAWDLGKFLSTEEMPRPKALRVSARGPLKVAVEVEYAWRASTIYHEIALEAGGDQVNITTSFDWRELGSEKDGARLVKFAVPFAVPGDKTFYEIPFGWIERPASMGEVPALRWAARSDGRWTAALLNDSRHGHDLAQGELRLSLIRGSHNPDPVPNQGWQSTRYALAIRRGAFDPAWLTRQAAAYNALTARLVASPSKAHGSLPLEHSLLAVSSPGMILSAYKQAEDGHGCVARFYNVCDKAAPARLDFDGPVGAAESVDLLERPAAAEPAPACKGREVSRPAGAHEIVTLRLTPKKKAWWQW
jgi:alpha-mannosidase